MIYYKHPMVDSMANERRALTTLGRRADRRDLITATNNFKIFRKKKDTIAQLLYLEEIIEENMALCSP